MGAHRGRLGAAETDAQGPDDAGRRRSGIPRLRSRKTSAELTFRNRSKVVARNRDISPAFGENGRGADNFDRSGKNAPKEDRFANPRTLASEHVPLVPLNGAPLIPFDAPRSGVSARPPVPRLGRIGPPGGSSA